MNGLCKNGITFPPSDLCFYSEDDGITDSQDIVS